MNSRDIPILNDLAKSRLKKLASTKPIVEDIDFTLVKFWGGLRCCDLLSCVLLGVIEESFIWYCFHESWLTTAIMMFLLVDLWGWLLCEGRYGCFDEWSTLTDHCLESAWFGRNYVQKFLLYSQISGQNTYCDSSVLWWIVVELCI